MIKNSLIKKIIEINRFLRIFGIPRKLLAVILLLMIIAAVGQAFTAGLFIPFLNSLQNTAVSSENNKIILFMSGFFSGVSKEYLFVYVLLSILLLMSFLQVLIIFTNRLILKFAMFLVQNKVSRTIFEEILNTQLKFFYKQSSGELINKLTSDVNRSYNCIYYTLQTVCQILFALAYIAMGLLILPRYTIGLILAMGVFIFIFSRILPYIYQLGKKNISAEEDANNIIVETIQGIRSIILSCAQKNHRDKFNGIIYKYYSTIFNSSWITTSLPLFVKLLSLLLIALVLLVNKNNILHGDPAYFSKLIFFIYICGNIFINLGTINSMHSSFAFSYEGLVSILKLHNDLKNLKSGKPGGKEKIEGFKEGIAAENLSFQYSEGEKVIEEMNFSIKKNQKVAFVGSSGSGKSTLIDLISGFHNDYSGSLSVEGKELRQIDKNSWRDLLGYVDQETIIFNDSIRNNLLFGFNREISDEEITQACKNAQIYDTIMAFKEKFDTELGERGIRLSGGEKQRLAIARLFLKNPSIVLLDEATSSLDSASEKKVKDALNALGKGRTMIAVAHRLSTIADFDRIYVLEKGRIVESGTHTELVAKKGHYFKYYTIQSMENHYEK